MSEFCTCPPEAGNAACELQGQRPAANECETTCPVCHQVGKPIQGQTVKALLALSLRAVRDVDYRFCRTPACPVVYFAEDWTHTFTVDQVRERVYQKEPGSADVFVCYCFRHTVGDVLRSADVANSAIMDDITSGIQAGQCACDLRNPQGSCCLGNVRALFRQVLQATAPKESAE